MKCPVLFQEKCSAQGAGMYILKTESREEAEELCKMEPLVTGGYATYKLAALQ